jgi:hypothetical protein
MYADASGWQDMAPMAADTEQQLPAAEQIGLRDLRAVLRTGRSDRFSKPIPCQQGEAGDILKELGVPADAT